MTLKCYEMETECKHYETAMRRFAKKYPEAHEEWREYFDWMHENGKHSDNDMVLADGTYNKYWRWALILEEVEGFYYISVIERS